MKDEFFLESLSNISGIDYMHVRKGIDPKFFLDRVLWFVKTIPDIYDKLPHQRFIHITGTSGKGTVGAMLMSILKIAVPNNTPMILKKISDIMITGLPNELN